MLTKIVGSICALLMGHAALAADQVLTTTIDGVVTEIFIPGEAKVLRGIFVHAANYKLKDSDRWAELCHQLQFAHVAMNIANVQKATNRGARLTKALTLGLKEFAEKSQHPELVNLPLAGTGHSAGGLVTGVLLQHPEKTLTNCIDCGWVMDPSKYTDEANRVPALFTIGAIPDAFKMLPSIEANFEPARKKGYPWGLGVQWGCAHDFGNSATLFVSWMQVIAELRLPKESSADGITKLRDLKEDDGWLGDRATTDGTFAIIAPFAEYKGDKQKAAWFPNKSVATIWRAYQTKESPVMLRAAAGDAKLADFSPKKSFDLMVNPGLDVVLSVAVKDGFSIKKVTFHEGDRLLGETTPGGEFKWTAPAKGCHPVYAQWETADGKTGVSNPALITVRAN